jgi:DNA polymerase-3 subunit delta
MKLTPREARTFFDRPDPGAAGILIYGPDPMRIAFRRKALMTALLGPGAAEEMRLTQLEPGDLRRDPAALTDAMRASGFFPGPRAVLIDNAGDGLAAALRTALDDWAAGDAVLVVTAGALAARSALRKAFEAHPTARAAPVYADPPGRDEVLAILAGAGLGEPGAGVLTDLLAMAAGMDPGDFAQFAEKLAVYKLSDPAPVSAEDIAAVAPLTADTALDDAIDLVAEGQLQALVPVLRRLAAQGHSPVAMAIAAGRHFRRLLAAASDPGGPAAGLARAQPPVFGRRRDQMARQARVWGHDRLESALRDLVALDFSLRSGDKTAADGSWWSASLIRLALKHARTIGLGRRAQGEGSRCTSFTGRCLKAAPFGSSGRWRRLGEPYELIAVGPQTPRSSLRARTPPDKVPVLDRPKARHAGRFDRRSWQYLADRHGKPDLSRRHAGPRPAGQR